MSGFFLHMNFSACSITSSPIPLSPPKPPRGDAMRRFMFRALAVRLLYLAFVCGDFTNIGCSGSEKSGRTDEKAAPHANPKLALAPSPRAKQDGLPPPSAELVLPRAAKPQSVLIVGKWL